MIVLCIAILQEQEHDIEKDLALILLLSGRLVCALEYVVQFEFECG